MSDRPNWHEIFRYEPNGTIWYKEQITSPGFRRKMDKPVGCRRGEGYLHFGFKGKTYDVHKVIWEMHYGPVNPGMEIDHKNNIRHDNRIENLQELTHPDNAKKRLLSKNNTTGYNGVYFRKGIKKFKAEIQVDYKQKHLGCFDTAEEAYEARKAAELHYYGARLMVSQ
jgi:hypothetical protein